MLILLIYILGIIATLWIWYYNLDNGTKITLFDLSFVILISIFSWIAFIVIIIMEYGDKTVFKKKWVMIDEKYKDYY